MKAPVSEPVAEEAAPGASSARRSLSVDGQAIVLAAVVALAIFLGLVPNVPW